MTLLQIAVMIGGFFVAGVLIGFALSDKVHEQVFDGMSKENSRLWAENRVLRGGKQ